MKPVYIGKYQRKVIAEKFEKRCTSDPLVQDLKNATIPLNHYSSSRALHEAFPGWKIQ
jgi:hypothetical protein